MSNATETIEERAARLEGWCCELEEAKVRLEARVDRLERSFDDLVTALRGGAHVLLAMTPPANDAS